MSENNTILFPNNSIITISNIVRLSSKDKFAKATLGITTSIPVEIKEVIFFHFIY